MAKTVANLRQQTRTYLDEATTADWTNTEVDREINAGFHEVVTAVMETYENFYLISTTFNTVASQQEYATTDGFPSDFFKMVRVQINYNISDSNSLYNRAHPVDLNEIDGDLANNAIGISVFRNAAYFLYGEGTGSTGIKLGFIPIPTRNGTNAIKIWYIPIMSDLSDSNTNVKIPYADRYYSLISLYAAATLLRKGQQEEIVARGYMAEFDIGLKKMRQQLEDRISDSSKHINDSDQMDVDFSNYSTI